MIDKQTHDALQQIVIEAVKPIVDELAAQRAVITCLAGHLGNSTEQNLAETVLALKNMKLTPAVRARAVSIADEILMSQDNVRTRTSPVAHLRLIPPLEE